MIYAVLPLIRTYTLPANTFGWSQVMNLRSGSGTLINPSYGLKLELHNSQFPRLVKLVEGHWSHGKRVFIERICYRDGSDFYPYRIRYIIPAEKYDKTFVFPKHIENIHYNLQGLQLKVMTPAQFYIKDVRPAYLQPVNVALDAHYRQQEPVLANICADDTTWYQSLIESCKFDLRRSTVGATYLFGNEEIDDEIRQNMNITIPVGDLLTPRTLTDPISRAALQAFIGENVLTDVSQPPPLQLGDGHTEFSPICQTMAASTLKEIPYTDLEIKYILSNQTVVHSEIKLLYDRYDRGLEHISGEAWGGMAVIHCLRVATEYASDPVALYGDIECTIKKTYNDEALITFTSCDGKQPLYACHFDLALSSLCSPGVITYPGIPQERESLYASASRSY